MSGEYTATIGMEVHAELKTRTKMFCSCANNPDEERPNVNICPVCTAQPGALPVINKAAVKHVLRVGLALGSNLADYTEFDRKNYFYPDLPKGYQISQYEFPLVAGGTLNGVQITRVHLEEDTASSIHDDKTGATLVDFNRSTVPLMELVTEPVIRSAEEAGAFGRELQLLLRYLGVSDANMEKGEMRVEANVSVSNTDKLGTKVELKNINSFRTMERAVAYEIKRQTEVLKSGGTIIQETRGWDENKQATFIQRVKEGSADYRYFPDPDLPSLKLSEISEFAHDTLKATLPELPWQRRQRYLDLGIKQEDADQYVREPPFGDFIDAIIKLNEGKAELIATASNYIANDLVKLVRDEDVVSSVIPISPQYFNTIITLLNDKKISSRSAKDVLAESVHSGEDPEQIIKEKNLIITIDTNAINEFITKIIADNPSVVADFKAGKAPALEFLVGQSMKALRGAADAGSLRDMIRTILTD